jgi:hypothetical protein
MTMADALPVENRARELLEAAGLSPPEEEIATLEMIYPVLRSRADTVFSVEQGYEA